METTIALRRGLYRALNRTASILECERSHAQSEPLSARLVFYFGERRGLGVYTLLRP